ncbi:hypothetical protein DFP72DRAFT_850095 [Ephemerocybe angulata]|uniref:Uncharacterized protein n=1 Tax=Ephemerocybe angulata TaxID=980116 RepID=A0A8H6HV07_9AGAR|nr:hypothetical protein DFP72DRAFT_850095 [Tulosesus angulatus]
MTAQLFPSRDARGSSDEGRIIVIQEKRTLSPRHSPNLHSLIQVDRFPEAQISYLRFPGHPEAYLMVAIHGRPPHQTSFRRAQVSIGLLLGDKFPFQQGTCVSTGLSPRDFLVPTVLTGAIPRTSTPTSTALLAGSLYIASRGSRHPHPMSLLDDMPALTSARLSRRELLCNANTFQGCPAQSAGPLHTFILSPAALPALLLSSLTVACQQCESRPRATSKSGLRF